MTSSAQAVPRTVDAVDVARHDVLEQRAVLAQWQGRRDGARAELETLEGRAGVSILDNPDAEDDVDDAIARLRRRVRNAEKAIEAQRPRIIVAESAYLAAEADALEEPARKAQAAVTKHRAKTDRLLRELEEHEEKFVPFSTHVEAISVGDVLVNAPSFRLPKSRPLLHEVAVIRFQIAYLREMAQGHDPAGIVEWRGDGPAPVPECVRGPGALVPTSTYLRSVERAHQVVAELEALRESLPAEIKEYEQTARLHVPADEVAKQPPIAWRRQRLEGLEAEVAEARAHLDALTASVARSGVRSMA